MASLFDKITTSSGKVHIKTPRAGSAIEFCNSSNPPKWFSLTVDQLVSVLEDIATNIDEFRARDAHVYDETNLRGLFDKYLSNPVAKALAGTQTMPVYTVVGSIIHWANSDDPYPEKTLTLDEEWIRNAVDQMKANSQQLVEAAAAGSNPPPQQASERLKGGENILYYGAPGTGKSHTAKSLANEHNAREFRTVFHPDMQNSDFVGSLKPGLGEGGNVTYQFRPGPFANAFRHAWDNPSERVHLVIEELNRAMAAAVFGELFQLLDRDANGTSEYTVDAPSAEFAAWLGLEQLALPSNLWIIATMNSADQGVYPLDTAFRRRWKQMYVRIDYTKAPHEQVDVVDVSGNTLNIPWSTFVEKLNQFLIEHLEIAEDRLVGPRFLGSGDLVGGRLPGKLLIYLWDDLLRHHGRHRLFHDDIRTYGQLDSNAAGGNRIFSADFLARFQAPVAAAGDS